MSENNDKINNDSSETETVENGLEKQKRARERESAKTTKWKKLEFFSLFSDSHSDSLVIRINEMCIIISFFPFVFIYFNPLLTRSHIYTEFAVWCGGGDSHIELCSSTQCVPLLLLSLENPLLMCICTHASNNKKKRREYCVCCTRTNTQIHLTSIQ